jgi:hypothetical protein
LVYKGRPWDKEGKANGIIDCNGKIIIPISEKYPDDNLFTLTEKGFIAKSYPEGEIIAYDFEGNIISE